MRSTPIHDGPLSAPSRCKCRTHGIIVSTSESCGVKEVSRMHVLRGIRGLRDRFVFTSGPLIMRIRTHTCNSDMFIHAYVGRRCIRTFFFCSTFTRHAWIRSVYSSLTF
ncbi:unnamed protein product, partial [Ectocarpus sp. 4 AP-2014]